MRHHAPSKAQDPPGCPVWFHLSAADVVAAQDTSPDMGLSEAEALRRLQRFGPNELKEAHRRGPARLLLEQFTDFLIVIAAAIISGVVGDLKDTLVIVLIVVLNAVVGFIQEYRAERAIAMLRQMAQSEAQVLRGGRCGRFARQSWCRAISRCWRRAISCRRICVCLKRRNSWSKRRC